MESDTIVTGSAGRAFRKGQVFGERYEILETVSVDALSSTLRAVDHESDANVLLHATVPSLVTLEEAKRMALRLKVLVGAGGGTLARLLDADREGDVVFTVEPWPRGTPLAGAIAARAGKKLDAAGALPIVARLAAAVSSAPDILWHGAVHLERVYVNDAGAVLTGGWLLSSVPGIALSEKLGEEPALAARVAPEVREGFGSRASDRYAVAAFTWELLKGGALPASRGMATATLGGVGTALFDLLAKDPAARPATLDKLVEALAKRANAPVPTVPLDPFPELEEDDEEEDVKTTVAAPRKPQAMVRRKSIGPKPGEAGAAPPKVKARMRGEDLDPDLVRAALAVQLDDDDAVREDGTEQMNLREERATPATEGTQQIDVRELEQVREQRAAVSTRPPASAPSVPAPPNRPPSMPAPPARAASMPASPIKPPSVVPVAQVAVVGTPTPPVAAPPAAAAPLAAKPAPVRTRPIIQPEFVALPEGIKPIPRPRAKTPSEAPPAMNEPALFDASSPPPATETVIAPAPAARPIVVVPSTPPQAAATQPWALLFGALFLGGLIVGVGFWYRASTQRDAERQEQIEQRLRELHGEASRSD